MVSKAAAEEAAAKSRKEMASRLAESESKQAEEELKNKQDDDHDSDSYVDPFLDASGASGDEDYVDPTTVKKKVPAKAAPRTRKAKSSPVKKVTKPAARQSMIYYVTIPM